MFVFYRIVPSSSALAVLIMFSVVPAVSIASEEGHHRHHLSVGLGATHAEGSNEPTVGAHYEYRINELFGVGALVDYAGGDLDSTIVAGVAFLHPYKGLVLLGAAGNENTHHGDEFLVRLGIGYDFELSGGWTLGPLLNFDFVEDEETKEMFGIVVGKHL